MASLIITFDATTPPPINGYVVKYRKIGDSSYTTISPNPTSVPVTIYNVDANFGYEGTVQSDCSNGILSPALPFSVSSCPDTEGVKLVNGVCTMGTRVNISSVYNTVDYYVCSYYYSYPDGTNSNIYHETTQTPCV